MRTILQVPMPTNLRIKAEKVARDSLGFSSIQELIRVILSQVASRNLRLYFKPEPVKLSAKAEKRYLAIEKDFQQGKNIYRASDIHDLMRQLNGNRTPRKVKK